MNGDRLLVKYEILRNIHYYSLNCMCKCQIIFVKLQSYMRITHSENYFLDKNIIFNVDSAMAKQKRVVTPCFYSHDICSLCVCTYVCRLTFMFARYLIANTNTLECFPVSTSICCNVEQMKLRPTLSGDKYLDCKISSRNLAYFELEISKVSSMIKTNIIAT